MTKYVYVKQSICWQSIKDMEKAMRERPDDPIGVEVVEVKYEVLGEHPGSYFVRDVETGALLTLHQSQVIRIETEADQD